MSDTDTYRVGDLIDIRDSDPIIVGWDAAMKEAERQSTASDFEEHVIGIWLYDGNGDVSLEGIYYASWCYTP